MRKVQSAHRGMFFALVSLVALLALLLAACGTNTNTGSGSSSPGGTTPTATAPTTTNTTGCPSNTTISTTPTPANIVLKPSNSNTTITAHVGDVIEVDLPFGQMWNGPTASQGGLQLQPPAGYPWTPTKVCVWRFTVQGAGTTQLLFTGKAICKKGEACPQYIMSLPYTIVAK